MNPDYMIEIFWLDFKQSMINFYQSTKTQPRPIKYWSDDMNILQSLKQYMEIESNINNYIILYTLDVMKSQSLYSMSILSTNIKRWEILIDKNNTFSKNIAYILFDIYFYLLKKSTLDTETNEIHILFSKFELFIINNDYNELIRYSVESNKPGILDKLKQTIDISKYIMELYKININKNTLGKKIINMIKTEN